MHWAKAIGLMFVFGVPSSYGGCVFAKATEEKSSANTAHKTQKIIFIKITATVWCTFR